VGREDSFPSEPPARLRDFCLLIFAFCLLIFSYLRLAAPCYIPSLRVLKEGGYEAVDSMCRYDQPGPLAEDVEERGFTAIRNVLKRVGPGR